MMAKAYILVMADPGRSKGVVDTLRDIPGVVGTHQVRGSYHVVVEIQAENLTDIPPILGEEIHKIPGIQSTTSLITLPTSSSDPITPLCLTFAEGLSST